MNKKWFTLVELIVVITILAVLWTISFVSYSNYTKDAQNAIKISDLSLIDKAINTSWLAWKWFAPLWMQKITYSAYPNDFVVRVGELKDNMIPDMPKVPIDPFTQKPYIASISEGSQFMQVGTILTNEHWDVPLAWILQTYAETKYADWGVPVQKIVWNYEPGMLPGVGGILPRQAVEDFEKFKETPQYSSWDKFYGVGWGGNNSYLFAMDWVPVVQVQDYTDSKVILHESFENIKVENSLIDMVLNRTMSKVIDGVPWTRVYKNERVSIPTCVSSSASMSLTYEFNSAYYDQKRTVECNIDRNAGVNSNSSLHLKWVRDSMGWDGQYNYITLDPTKKYEYSLDVKGHLSSEVDGGKLKINFVCYQKDPQTNIRTAIPGSSSFLMPLDPNNFQRLTAYINKPDPTSNGLSINLPQDTTDSISCIFYRTNAPKAWDELWFDNYTVKEVD